MKWFYRTHGKRLLDLGACVAIIPLALPVLAVTGLAVYAWLGRPVIFRQRRPGRNGIPFLIRKFRTMSDRRDSHGEPLPDADRISRFGRLLRSTSLDELPEIVNVLRGEMSLVGPRPLLMEYLELYNPRQFRRHEVRPGITGWAQVNGRNALTWDQKFELDLWYVENCSLWIDLKILAWTALSLFRRNDIHAQNHATMPKFKGGFIGQPTIRRGFEQ